MNVFIFVGILFTIGAIIEESQGQHDKSNYLVGIKCARSRSLLVLKWTVLGFLLTISYKSVLRAIMMKTEYEDTIDTIDDMLQSDKQFMLPSDIAIVLGLAESDPRKQVQILTENAEYFVQGKITPLSVVER